MDVVHPLLWKQIPPCSPQLSLAPFFSGKEHSHMPLLTLLCLFSTALCPVLVIGARSGARCADLTLPVCFTGFLVFCLKTNTDLLSQSEKVFGLWRIFVSLFTFSFPFLSSLFPPTLSSSVLSAVASSLFWLISSSKREEQRREGCGWAEW